MTDSTTDPSATVGQIVRPVVRTGLDVCSGPSLSRAERLAELAAAVRAATRDVEQPVPTPRAIAAE